ncbi:unnamed protein product, partial [Didymodactylos carnosus]
DFDAISTEELIEIHLQCDSSIKYKINAFRSSLLQDILNSVDVLKSCEVASLDDIAIVMKINEQNDEIITDFNQPLSIFKLSNDALNFKICSLASISAYDGKYHTQIITRDSNLTIENIIQETCQDFTINNCYYLAVINTMKIIKNYIKYNQLNKTHYYLLNNKEIYIVSIDSNLIAKQPSHYITTKMLNNYLIFYQDKI